MRTQCVFAVILAITALLTRSETSHADENDAAITAAKTATAAARVVGDIENAIAQGKITITPTQTLTVTPTPTRTPSPVSTPTVAVYPSTTATQTPEPCWLTDQDLGDPESGYIVFDENGAPVPCPDPMSIPTDEPTATPTPTPIVTSTPIIIYIQVPVVITATPVPQVPSPPTSTPQPQGNGQISTPTKVNTSQPTSKPTAGSAHINTLVPTIFPTAVPESVDGSAQSPVVAAPIAPVDPLIPDHMPPPMLVSFGLLAGSRRRVEEETPPWLPQLA